MKDIYNVKDVLSGDAIKKLEQKLGGTLAFLVLETTDEEPILVTSSGFGPERKKLGLPLQKCVLRMLRLVASTVSLGMAQWARFTFA